MVEYTEISVFGRPSKYDLVKEAQDLLKWSERDDALRLYGFVDDKDYCYDQLNDFAARSKDFRLALYKAKNRLAKRREEKVSTGELAQCVYNKTAHIYDNASVDSDEAAKDRQLERDLKKIEKEIQLKAMGGQATQEEQEKLNNIYSLVDQLQEMSSKRKKADNSIKTDNKS